MKSKKVTYALILSVAAVWGIIFYRVFQSAADDDEYTLPAALPTVNYDALDDFTDKDTFSLVLNYPDPFLKGNTFKNDVPSPVSVNQADSRPFIPAKPSPPVINWSSIQYSGYVTSPTGRQIVSILFINNKEYMLLDGQEAEGLKILKNVKDSVRVSYKGKTRFLKIQ